MTGAEIKKYWAKVKVESVALWVTIQISLFLDSCYSNGYYSYKEFYDPDLPNYTDAINELLDREEQNFINYRNWSYAGQGISDLIGLGGLLN